MRQKENELMIDPEKLNIAVGELIKILKTNEQFKEFTVVEKINILQGTKSLLETIMTGQTLLQMTKNLMDGPYRK